MSYEIHIGTKLVCINDDWKPHRLAKPYIKQPPQYGEVYTVRGISPTKDYTFLTFEELSNSVPKDQLHRATSPEISWNSNCFAPVKRIDTIEEIKRTLVVLKTKVQQKLS